MEVFAEQEVAQAPRGSARRGTDRYPTDIPILIVSALLAASTFLEWYKGPPGYGITATGWSSGTWGPVIFFLAVGSVVLVALRRIGVHVSLPVDESLLHEGTGWLSLVGAVVKSRFFPGPDGLLSRSNGVWIAVAAAAILIVLAGRMSPHAPFVMRPGWHKAKAGLIGIIVLALVVAGSAVFGAMNSASLQPKGNGRDLFNGTVRGRLPDCAKSFPLPAGLKPQYGFRTGSSCQAVLTSAKSPNDQQTEFRSLLNSKHYVFTEAGTPGSVIFTVTMPRCATLAVVPGETGSTVAVALTPCGPPTSSGRPSPPS